MGLEVIKEHGLWNPVFFCDGCGRKIATAVEGNFYYWLHDVAVPVKPLILHKRCSPADHSEMPKPPEGHEPGTWSVVELRDVPLQLAVNSQVLSKSEAEKLVP